jgi:hypothetical protein
MRDRRLDALVAINACVGAMVGLERSTLPVTAETPERTRVELERRNLDRHGEGCEAEREGVGGDGGWPLCPQRSAELLKD